jgi:PAS domain S-box-containing protein
VDSGKEPNASNLRSMLGPVETSFVVWTPNKGPEILIQGANNHKREFPQWFRLITPLTPYTESQRIYHEDHYAGTLDVEFSPRAWRNHLWGIFLRQVVILVSGIVVLFAIAFWVVYQNISSVKELQGIISGITRTDFGTHFQIPKGVSHEIGDFVTAVRKQFSVDLERIINAVNGATDAISICNPDGRAIFLNRAFLDMFGYSIDEVNRIGGTAAVLASKVLLEKGCPIIKTGGAWSGEIEVSTKSGKSIPVFMRGNAIRDDMGQIIGLIAVISDISEKKRAEQLAERMGRILDSSLNEIYVFDAQTLKFIQVSHGARQNLG